MDKLKMHSIDGVAGNVDKIGALFPNCVTETIRDGKVVRAIDFDMLRQELSDVVVDGPVERYQFTWPDKRKSVLAANAPITATLRPVVADSVGRDGTPGGFDSENLYIEGDNLEVLKLLQETYLGKVKMIYIDPPYNTGNDFVYADDFAQSAGEYMENSGQYDEAGNRMVTNTESNGRFHTDWLNMIYPRLRLAKDLLADDGVIFISIDENEVASLRKIGDEIFGANNFVSNLIWQSRTSISNDYEISLNHNHTLIYSKNRILLLFGGDAIDCNDYINPDSDPRGPWKLVPLDANHAGGDTVYPVRNPKTGIDYYPPNGRIWCYNEKTMQKLLEDGRIKFGLNDDSSPKRKLYLNERLEKGDVKTPSSLVLDAGTTKTGTTTIMALFDGNKVFDYPKSVEFIQRLVQYGAPKGGIILDFFSGSSTTAHAVFKESLNNEYKYSFILVQLPEDLDKSLDKADSSAKKTIISAVKFLDSISKPHTICEIGKERIRRAGTKIKEDSPLTTANLDTGFRVLKLDSSNMKDVYYNPEEYTMGSLFGMADNIKEDRTPEDLLFQVMLDLGILLSSKIEETTIAGKKVFSVADGYLYACFDSDVSEETVKAIAQKKPYYAVFRDSGFATDSVATNFEQIFETYSPSTTRKVL